VIMEWVMRFSRVLCLLQWVYYYYDIAVAMLVWSS
jgi:hypothetical protein